ncbi:hypothetical protein P3T21_003845 [Paraburkholderia sp. GAS334]
MCLASQLPNKHADKAASGCLTGPGATLPERMQLDYALYAGVGQNAYRKCSRSVRATVEGAPIVHAARRKATILPGAPS